MWSFSLRPGAAVKWKWPHHSSPWISVYCPSPSTLVIFPASIVDNSIRSGMNTYSISCKDSKRCSCTVPIWHRGAGEIFRTLPCPLGRQLCLHPSFYKCRSWDSRGVRWPSQRPRARIWKNQEWHPRFWTLIFSSSETSSPGGTLKVRQRIVGSIEQATESHCRPGSRSVKSCFWSLGLKVKVFKTNWKREKLVKWRPEQRPLQLFGHEVNKTLDQNKSRNGEERVDPRKFSKEQAIRFCGNEGWEQETVKDKPNCRNHGGWLTVSQACSHSVAPFLEKGRAFPHPSIRRMAVLSATSERHQLIPLSAKNMHT